jgi:hypothetical protein
MIRENGLGGEKSKNPFINLNSREAVIFLKSPPLRVPGGDLAGEDLVAFSMQVIFTECHLRASSLFFTFSLFLNDF